MARSRGGYDHRPNETDRRRGFDGGDAAARTAIPPLLARLAISRNFFYSGGDVESDSTVRFRNRLEFLLPLNKARITDDGARYFLADWEWFIPLDDPDERFANRQRIRTGIGYRRSFNWRYELLYIWTRSRDTTDQGFSTTENIINVRVKRLF
jgi:hypothetical protein